MCDDPHLPAPSPSLSLCIFTNIFISRCCLLLSCYFPSIIIIFRLVCLWWRWRWWYGGVDSMTSFCKRYYFIAFIDEALFRFFSLLILMRATGIEIAIILSQSLCCCWCDWMFANLVMYLCQFDDIFGIVLHKAWESTNVQVALHAISRSLSRSPSQSIWFWAKIINCWRRNKLVGLLSALNLSQIIMSCDW